MPTDPPPFLSAFLWPKAAMQMGLYDSSFKLSFSLECTFVRPASPLPHHYFLCLLGLGHSGRSVQPILLGDQSSGLWYTRMLTLFGAGKVPQPTSLCAVLRERKWEQCGMHAMQHGVKAFHGPLLVGCTSNMSLLPTVQAGQSKSRERGLVLAALHTPDQVGQREHKKGTSFHVHSILNL